jgi:predicted helicase
MIKTIITAIVFTALFGGKPIARAVERVADKVSVKRQEKEARKAAMDRYMQMHAMDIEH